MIPMGPEVMINRVIDRILRLKRRWRLFKNTGNELKRRVRVENALLEAAAGKRELPDAEECRRLAYELGIPDRDRIP